MHIGINCFEDVEIRTIITSIGEKGTCDLTQEKHVYIYDTESVSEDYDIKAYFLEIIDVYTPESMLPSDFPKENLKMFEEILLSDWSIFSVPKEKVKQIMNPPRYEPFLADKSNIFINIKCSSGF